MARGPRRGSAAGDRRIARKMAKIEAATHAGAQGQTILEMIEQQLATAAESYLATNEDGSFDPSKRLNARGQIRGLSMAIALMRYPTRRYEMAWWNYVKKLEKRAVAQARQQLNTT